MAEERRGSLPRQLTVLTLARLLLNSGTRMTYPFLPALARGLGVPLAGIEQLITLRNLSGFLGPLFGPLSDRYGRRPVLVGAMLFFSAGCLVVVIWPAYWPLGITLAIIAVAKVIYDPAMQAFLGDTVPYRLRGRALAVTELSWAGSLLVGAPLIGLTINRFGWSSPFLMLGLLGVAAVVLLWRSIPLVDGRGGRALSLRANLALIRRERVVWAAAVYIICIMAANELLLIIFGDWLETAFQLSLTDLGLAAGVIGGAEVVGEIAAGVGADRFGKRPVVVTSALATAVAYLALPMGAATLTGALLLVFLLFVAFEITVVAGVPLMTEIVPQARGIVMSIVLAGAAVGRTLGAALGPAVWRLWGLPGSGVVAALLTLAGALIIAFLVHEAETNATPS